MRAHFLLPGLWLLALGGAWLVSASIAQAETRAVRNGSAQPQMILYKQSRVLLGQARAEGQQTVSLVIASREGWNARVTSRVDELGGRIRSRVDDVDFLRASLPTDAVEALAASEGVLRVDLDVSTGLYQPQEDAQPTAVSPGKTAVPPPDIRTPAVNPYLPTHAMGAPQFAAQNPTFDGRGVVIGIIEPGVDLLLPELQEAITLEGETTRKIIDFVTTSDPESGDPMWVSVEPFITGAGSSIKWHGVAYTAPRDGAYRIGQLDERVTGRIGAEDLNRDGNPLKSSRVFGVLVDPKERTVWVDVDQDHSFADERPLKNYRERFDIGLFQPAMDSPRDRVPFAVQLSEDAAYVHFNLDAPHGTLVASTAAGRKYFGGEMNGAAPGAQVVLIQAGNLVGMGALIDALVLGFRDPRIDIVTCSCGPYVGLNDGKSLVMDIVVDRLMTRYRKPLTGGAGNAPWLNLVTPPGSSGGAFAISGYVDRETFATNIGIAVPRKDYLPAYARGPREDGGLQPFVVAPTFALTGGSIKAQARVKPYPLPRGYGIGGGTSQATPMVAGALALLISAAKQRGLPYDVDRLRLAVATGARFLKEYGAYEQGNGVIQVGPSWDALQRMTGVQTRIQASAPVNTELSPLLATPGVGEGLYEREGWHAGMHGTRMITFKRESGPQSSVDYDLRWVGNDGTFEVEKSVSLPLNREVAVPVTVRTRSPGVHSAILNLMNRENGTIAHQVMHTVVVAEPLDATNGYMLKRTLPIDTGELGSIFFRVPGQAKALHVSVGADQGRVKLEGLLAPSGDPSDRYPAVYRRPSGKATLGHDAWLTVEDPAPGVWQVQFSNVREFAADVEEALPMRTKAKITIAAYGATLNSGADGKVGVSNDLAEFDGAVASLGAGIPVRSELAFTATSAQIVRDIDVLPGTEYLLVSTESQPDVDVDLSVLFCATATSCVPMMARTGLGGNEEILVPKPASGRWVAIIDPARIPTGGAQVKYTELVTNSQLGRLRTDDTVAQRSVGAMWTAMLDGEQENPDGDEPLAVIAAVTSKGIPSYHPSNGGRQPGARPIGDFSLTEVPAVLGKVLVSLSKGDVQGVAGE